MNVLFDLYDLAKAHSVTHSVNNFPIHQTTSN